MISDLLSTGNQVAFYLTIQLMALSLFLFCFSKKKFWGDTVLFY